MFADLWQKVFTSGTTREQLDTIGRGLTHSRTTDLNNTLRRCVQLAYDIFVVIKDPNFGGPGGAVRVRKPDGTIIPIPIPPP